VGRVLLVGRLAARNLRRRPVEAALLLLAITAATTVLTLGLVLRGVTDDPYEDTRVATAGPDVVASVGPDPFNGPADLAGLEALTDASGVVDQSGPYPAVGGELEADGVTGSRRTPRGEEVGGAAGVWAVGRDPAASSVDRPELTQGAWVRDGGAVLEAGFADALDVDVGDQITLRTRMCTGRTPTTPPDCRVVNGRSFRVVGVAVTAAARPYPDVCFAPECPWFAEAMEDAQAESPPPDASVDDVHFVEDPVEPGLVWLTEADVRGLAPSEEFLSYVVNLKLADPTDAPAFVEAHLSSSTGSPILESWRDIRDAHDQVVKDQQQVLLIGSRLLGLLAVASVAVLVGGRMADQTRRVGLLKAVGSTPRLVAVVLLTEYLVLALVAAAAGLAAGWLAARAQIHQDAQLVGGTDPNTVRANQVLLVITVTLVALAAVNVIFVTWATALDAKHASALARALGATPQQVSTGLSAAQVLPALAGAVLGIAGGLALFNGISGETDGVTGPPLWQLLAVVPVTVLVVSALTAIPARLGARRPTAEILQAELA